APVVALSANTPGLLDVHVIVRPVSTAPLAERSSAEKVWVAPGARSALGGVTVTLVTGSATVTVAVPFTPSTVARIVAVPGATAVTVAVAPAAGATVATAGVPLVQEIARPVI